MPPPPPTAHAPGDADPGKCANDAQGRSQALTEARGARCPTSTLLPPPQCADPAGKNVRCGVGDRPRCTHIQLRKKKGRGPWLQAARTGAWGRESAGLRTPLTGALLAPPSHGDTLLPPPRRTTTARNRVRCGVGDGPPRPHPPRPKTKRSGPWPHAPGTDGRGRESAHPWTTFTDATGAPPPGSPSCRPHSPQRQLAGACAAGLMTGPRARIPRPQKKKGCGPRLHVPQTGSRAGEVPHPGHPTQRNKAPPSPPRDAILLAPRRRPPPRRSVRCAVGDRPPHPHPRSQRKSTAGTGARPEEWRTGRGGAQPRTTLTEA